MRFFAISVGVAVLGFAGWSSAQDSSSQPHAVPVTRLETKKALEAWKFVRPRLPMPPSSEKEESKGARGGTNNQVRMRVLYLDPNVGALWPRDYSEPTMTLPSNVKRPLLWITSRVNNCLY